MSRPSGPGASRRHHRLPARAFRQRAGRGQAHRRISRRSAATSSSPIRASRRRSGSPPLPRDGLIEAGKYGPLPRIGDDGTRPLDAYARPAAGHRRPEPRGDRHRRHRRRRRGERHRHQPAARRSDARLRALWRPTCRPRWPKRGRPATKSSCRCRWSPTAIPISIPARRRSPWRPARPRTSIACTGSSAG